jgi:hypothetical protein
MQGRCDEAQLPYGTVPQGALYAALYSHTHYPLPITHYPLPEELKGLTRRIWYQLTFIIQWYKNVPTSE